MYKTMQTVRKALDEAKIVNNGEVNEVDSKCIENSPQNRTSSNNSGRWYGILPSMSR